MPTPQVGENTHQLETVAFAEVIDIRSLSRQPSEECRQRRPNPEGHTAAEFLPGSGRLFRLTLANRRRRGAVLGTHMGLDSSQQWRRIFGIAWQRPIGLI